MEAEDLIRKRIASNRIKIAADIILVIVLCGIFFYVYSEIENFKTLKEDVCALCEQKTGALCMKGFGVTQPCPPFHGSSNIVFRGINLSEYIIDDNESGE